MTGSQSQEGYSSHLLPQEFLFRFTGDESIAPPTFTKGMNFTAEAGIRISLACFMRDFRTYPISFRVWSCLNLYMPSARETGQPLGMHS